MSAYYSMPANRTYCERFRCCREKEHEGDCEMDITYLTDDQLESIRNSGNGKD
jgi:hypothetical protein